MELKILQHELCGGECEIMWIRSRFDEAAAVVIQMKWTEVVKTCYFLSKFNCLFLDAQPNSTLPKKCLILIWCQEKMELKIPQHELCGGRCEITWDKSRFDEAAAVVIEMKWTHMVKNLPSRNKK